MEDYESCLVLEGHTEATAMVGMCSGLVGYIAYLKGRLYDYLLTEEECFFLYLEITILVVLLIFNMLLVIGVVLENTGILLAWVIAHALYAFFLISKFTTSFYDAVVTVELLYCVGVLVFYLSILWLVLYSIMVVYSYRALIKAAENCPCVDEEKLRLRDYDNEEDQRSGGGGKRMPPMDNRMYGETPESPVQPLRKSTMRRSTPPQPPPPQPPPPPPTHQSPPPPPTPPRQSSLMSQRQTSLVSQTMPPPRQSSIQSQPLPVRRQPSIQSHQSHTLPPPRQSSLQSQEGPQQPTRLSSMQSQAQDSPPHASFQQQPQQVQMTWKKQSIAPSTPSLPSPPEAASSRNASMTYAGAGASGIQSHPLLSMSGQGNIPHSPNVSRVGMVLPVTYKKDWSPRGSIQLLSAAPARPNTPNQPWRMAILNPNPNASPPAVRAPHFPMAPARPWRQASVVKTSSPLASVASEGVGSDPAQQPTRGPPTQSSPDEDEPSPSRTTVAHSPPQKPPRKSRLARDSSRVGARASEHSGGSDPQKSAPPTRKPSVPDRRSPPDVQINLVRKTSIAGETITAQPSRTQPQAATTTSGPTARVVRPVFEPRYANDPHPFGSDGGLGRLWRNRTERAKLRRSPVRK